MDNQIDLSLLYFFFPRLSESRRVLSRHVVFDDVKRTHCIELKKPLPLKRHSQHLRMVIDTDTHDAGWRRFVYERPDELVSITGFADDSEGKTVRYPFRWAGSCGGSIDFCADSNTQFARIEIECAVQGAYDLVWVCAARNPK